MRVTTSITLSRPNATRAALPAKMLVHSAEIASMLFQPIVKNSSRRPLRARIVRSIGMEACTPRFSHPRSLRSTSFSRASYPSSSPNSSHEKWRMRLKKLESPPVPKIIHPPTFVALRSFTLAVRRLVAKPDNCPICIIGSGRGLRVGQMHVIRLSPASGLEHSACWPRWRPETGSKRESRQRPDLEPRCLSDKGPLLRGPHTRLSPVRRRR
jgi:hypothetical protein